MLLLVTVGLPYFVLSTTSPLVQVWFSRSYPGRSPYRLYALSNFGSLAALLSYPFVFEPAFDLPRQSWLWSGAFAGYVLLCGLCAAWLWRCRSAAGVRAAAPATMPPPNDCPHDASAGVRWLRRALVVAAARLRLADAAGHHEPRLPGRGRGAVSCGSCRWRCTCCRSSSVSIIRGGMCGACGPCWPPWPSWSPRTRTPSSTSWPSCLHGLSGRFPDASVADYLQELVIYFSTMFFICMVCHGELVRLRPDPRRLTEFYLMMSAGGALGGVFVSLVAPLIFKTFFEWQLGLVLVLRRGGGGHDLGRRSPGGPPRTEAAPATRPWARPSSAWSPAATPAAAARWATRRPSIASRMTVERARNFYGIVTVHDWKRDQPAQHQFVMRHGAIEHGEQFADPEKRHIPLTYYRYDSGVGRTIQYLQKQKPTMRVGVVGLGAGTIAAYARKGDNYRFYEINPAVNAWPTTAATSPI